jgi:hypothetical protein
MRRVLLGALAAAVAVGGCGSSSTGSPASPLATVVSYFPATSPFVLTVNTNAQSRSVNALKTAESRIPFFAAVKAAELSRLPAGIEKDIKSLAGDPAAVGDAGGSHAGFAAGILVVWMTRDATNLSALVKKLPVHRTGTLDGATLYGESSGEAFAVAGPTLLIASSQSTLSAAIARHAHGQGITAGQHAAAVAGLDPNAAIQVFGDLEGVLSRPSAAKARRIPWVAAIHDYGADVSVSSNAITLRFRVGTDGSGLPPSELPIASGSSSPGVVNAFPIQTAIHDPAQIFSFVESAEQATSPLSYARFRRKEARLERRTGVDINRLIDQLSGDLIVSSDTRTTLARVTVNDPATVSAMFTKLASVPGTLGGGSILKRVAPGTVSYVEAGRHALLGVVGNQLVLAVPPTGGAVTPALLKSFAAAPTATVPGQSGAVVFRIKIEALVALLDKRPPSPLGRAMLALLGDVTGSVSATPAALTGTATVAIR